MPEVDFTRWAAQFEYNSSQKLSMSQLEINCEVEIRFGTAKKNTQSLKNHENVQKCSDFITLQKSTTRTDGWFGKLRLGARKITNLGNWGWSATTSLNFGGLILDPPIFQRKSLPNLMRGPPYGWRQFTYNYGRGGSPNLNRINSVMC